MIIDSHVYCFTPIDTPGGHESGAVRMRFAQAGYSGHQQPAYRIKDLQPGPSDVLNPKASTDLMQLPDLQFRANYARGRMVWNYNGDEYTKQFFPPNLRNLEFTPFSLSSEMDYAGVNAALIHTDPMLGRDSAYLAECKKVMPGRLKSMIPVDEWRIKDDTDAVIQEVTDAVKVHGLDAIKFNPLGYASGPESWDDNWYRPFWEAVTKLNVPVFFTLGTGPDFRNRKRTKADEIQGYLNEHRILMKWMERYPNNVCSLTHGFPWRLFLDGNKIVLPADIWAPFKGENCNLEVCFPVRLGDLFDYPYREVWPTLEAMLKNIGADHLLWGTDMPFQNRFCTYRQSRQYIEKYCTNFIGKSEMAMIMGGTAKRILGF
ncbi:MAG: amidohydrolase [SAR202 cluster bacterium]|nr:amidohydrolase [SAR202 cluster bacterium]